MELAAWVQLQPSLGYTTARDFESCQSVYFTETPHAKSTSRTQLTIPVSVLYIVQWFETIIDVT